MNTEYAIHVESVCKDYRLYKRNSDRIKETFHPFRKQYHKPFRALENVSFSLEHGGSLGIIGKNGSGKSTLLQILCGVLQPSAGEVSVHGRISALLELGAGFNPEFTGRENVYMTATIMGLSREYVDRNLDRIFDFADIGEYVDQPVKLYSSGMYVRLAFATAISIEPEILIVDEALAVGDIFFQQKCIAHMKEMQSKATIVFVTHDMQTVSNLCDRVILLDEGSVKYDGNPVEAVSHYTKLVHNERFQEKGALSATDSSATEHNTDCPGPVNGDKEEGWVDVPAEDRGGALEIDIHKVRIVDLNGSPKETVVKGDTVVIELFVKASKDIDNVIVGYTVKDRMGNSIFGENTCSSLETGFSVEEGFSLIRYQFEWPEVYPEKYTITVGVGEGKDPFVHKIHCWAHNIGLFTALSPEKGIHGIFNNVITSCDIRPFI